MRGVTLPSGKKIILSDTVGFISDLPTQLVEAFRSTLEEVADADLLVHVLDGSDVDPLGQINAVRAVLTDIGGDPDDQPPCRFRRWMLSEDPTLTVDAGLGCNAFDAEVVRLAMRPEPRSGTKES